MKKRMLSMLIVFVDRASLRLVDSVLARRRSFAHSKSSRILALALILTPTHP